MDWKLQLGISIVVPIVSSLLTYLAAIKKSKNDVYIWNSIRLIRDV